MFFWYCVKQNKGKDMKLLLEGDKTGLAFNTFNFSELSQYRASCFA